MKVTDILVRDASLLQLEAADKDQVLTEMAKALGAAEPSVDAENLLAVHCPADLADLNIQSGEVHWA